MLQALKSSNESRELVDVAVRYLRGVKGTLVQQKRRDREKMEGARLNGAAANAPAAANAVGGPRLGAGGGQQRLGGAGARDMYGPYAYPQQQVQMQMQQHQQQMLYQQVVPGVGQAHAEGWFDEGDVESALRGFLGRG